MAKTLSYILGIVVLVLGILGYFMDPIFGIFEVDVIHSSIYVVLGALLLVMAMSNAVMGAKIVGIITAIVAILGFIPPSTSILGIVETNTASSVLQIIVAVVLLIAGFMEEGNKEEVNKMKEEPKREYKEPEMQEGMQQGGMGENQE